MSHDEADADDLAEARRARRRAASLECWDGTCGGCPRCGVHDAPEEDLFAALLRLPVRRVFVDQPTNAAPIMSAKEIQEIFQ